MKRRICAALIGAAAMAVAAVAQAPDSTSQMRLVSSPTFTARLQYVGWQIAREVLSEKHDCTVLPTTGCTAPRPYTPACHQQRAAYARSWMQNPATAAVHSAVGIVGTNEAGAVIVGTANAEGTDSTVNDLSLKQAYRWIWNDLSLCDTGS